MTSTEKNHIAKHCDVSGRWCEVPQRAKYAGLPPEKWRFVDVYRDTTREKYFSVVQCEDGRMITYEAEEDFWYGWHGMC